tara:strand:+ start:18522 stop:20075 length:1554 start_codon:yes stop_codon:yes gene_type:complete
MSTEEFDFSGIESDFVENYEPEGNNVIEYISTPTMSKFHTMDTFVRGIRGPIGSGKSVGCCFEVFLRCKQQRPDKSGIRRSRWAVIRNTYPELETTTIKTWLDWFPENIFGRFRRRVPFFHHIRYDDIDAEIYFLAMDKPDDVKKLLSLELTGVWVNEAREIPLEVVQTCTERVGRYPSKRAGGPTWYGVIMDTNPPEENHWWAQFEGFTELDDGVLKPNNWEFLTQPGAMLERKTPGGGIEWISNPEAENAENLPADYYTNLIQGKTHAHIRIYVGNKFGSILDGKLVYPNFNPDAHISNEPLRWIPGRVITVGLDFGRTPAASFSQQTPRGQIQDVHELVCEDMGAENFAKALYNECKTVFPDAKFNFWGDPSGGFGGQSDERTYFDILRANRIVVRGAPTQNKADRLSAGEACLSRLVDGQPGYLISPTCFMLKQGFTGGFHYRKLKTPGKTRYAEDWEKNEYSHIHEARQYAYCGMGEIKVVKGKNKRKDERWNLGGSRRRTFKAKTGFSPLR